MCEILCDTCQNVKIEFQVGIGEDGKIKKVCAFEIDANNEFVDPEDLIGALSSTFSEMLKNKIFKNMRK
jgi:hypothetical protein